MVNSRVATGLIFLLLTAGAFGQTPEARVLLAALASSSLTASQKERVTSLPGLSEGGTGRDRFLDQGLVIGVVAKRLGYRDTDRDDLAAQLRMQATDQVVRTKASQSPDYLRQAEKLKLGKAFPEAFPDLLVGVTGTIGKSSYEHVVIASELGVAIVSAKDSDVVVKEQILLIESEVAKKYNIKLLELARSALQHVDSGLCSRYLLEAKSHGDDSLEFYTILKESYAAEGRQAEVQRLETLIATRFSSGGSDD